MQNGIKDWKKIFHIGEWLVSIIIVVICQLGTIFCYEKAKMEYHIIKALDIHLDISILGKLDAIPLFVLHGGKMILLATLGIALLVSTIHGWVSMMETGRRASKD